MDIPKKKTLFIVNPTSPMVFCFAKDPNLCLWEKERLERHICNNGGIVIGYADYLEIEDKGCIILAKKDYNPHLENNNVFDVNFVDDCIKKEKVLDISKYKLGKKPKNFCSCEHTRELTGITDCCIFTNGVLKFSQNEEGRTPQNDLRKIIEKLNTHR